MKYLSQIIPALLILLVSIPGFLFAQDKPKAESHQTKKGELLIYPILHATVVMEWDGKTIYIDPYGGAELFEAFEDADFVLITHAHGDHLNRETLKGLNLKQTTLIAPKSVLEELGENIMFETVIGLNNGSNVDQKGFSVTAVPMYNLPETDESRHKKGWGNGYVIELGGKRIYISGDTEDIPEMRNLKDIDIAFV